MKKVIKNIMAFSMVAMLCITSIGCSKASNDDKTVAEMEGLTVETDGAGEGIKVEFKERTPINIGVLKGPTGMGATKLMEDDSIEESSNDYTFTVASSPDELTAKIISGELDIASVPTNLASVLYNKTEGGVKMLAVNTLGVLHLIHDKSVEINSIEDLKGKTIYSTGQGATPEYVIDFILKQNGIDDVKVEYMQEHAELATALISGDVSIGILPEPNVTTALSKNDKLQHGLDLTKEWEKACKGTEFEGSLLSMGCVIVRTEFLNENKDAVDDFLDEYKDSINFANENIDMASTKIEKYGIIPSEDLAKKAIPNCNMVYIDNEEMKNSISRFLEVLYNANPKAVGGKLPDEEFYYTK